MHCGPKRDLLLVMGDESRERITILSKNLKVCVCVVNALSFCFCLASSWLLGDRTYTEVRAGKTQKNRKSKLMETLFQSSRSTKGLAHVDRVGRVFRKTLALNLDTIRSVGHVQLVPDFLFFSQSFAGFVDSRVLIEGSINE